MKLRQSRIDSQQTWFRDEAGPDGVTRLHAEMFHEGHVAHSHDTYTISVTDWGVQEFTYRGSVHRCLPGQVNILHPDETHDGRPGQGIGFGYRSLYIEPVHVHDAVRAILGPKAALPFVRSPVVADAVAYREVVAAFDGELEELSAQATVASIAGVLLRATGGKVLRSHSKLDLVALDRAAEFLRENALRVVRSSELEAACGLKSSELGVQFKRRYGTSPYRYLLLRRLAIARAMLLRGVSIAAAAAETGFSDQSHMTRAFRRTYGFTPARISQLHSSRSTD